MNENSLYYVDENLKENITKIYCIHNVERSIMLTKI